MNYSPCTFHIVTICVSVLEYEQYRCMYTDFCLSQVLWFTVIQLALVLLRSTLGDGGLDMWLYTCTSVNCEPPSALVAGYLIKAVGKLQPCKLCGDILTAQVHLRLQICSEIIRWLTVIMCTVHASYINDIISNLRQFYIAWFRFKLRRLKITWSYLWYIGCFEPQKCFTSLHGVFPGMQFYAYFKHASKKRYIIFAVISLHLSSRNSMRNKMGNWKTQKM